MTAQTSSQSLGTRLLRGLIGAALGALTMGPFLAFGGPLLIKAGTGAIALSGVAVIYLLIGAFVGLGTLLPGAGQHVLNVAVRDDLVDQRANLLGGSAAMIVIGASLLLLCFSGPVGVVPAEWAVCGLVVTAVAIVWLTLAQQRREDELARQLSLETGAIALTIGLPFVAGWAALAFLKLAPAIEPLWLIAIDGFVLLIASFIAAGRRGLLSQPAQER
ncbi:MAG: hypothetical protein ACKOQM_08890 [Novosphingobium sp.]